MSYGFLVFKPRVPGSITSPEELSEQTTDPIGPAEERTLLERILPSLGVPRGDTIDYEYMTARITIRFREGFIGIDTRGPGRPGVREFLAILLDAGLVIFDCQKNAMYRGEPSKSP